MPDPNFAPVFPELSGTEKPVTGSLYNDGKAVVGGISDSWFGRRKNFKVGDIVVVVLDERAQASRTQNTTVERERPKTMLRRAIFGKIPIIKNNIGGLKVDGSTITSEASGVAGQEASLTGQIAVSVVQILPNGNLVVKGEKKLDLSEGSEVIRVAGIVRTEDVAPNGTVFSRRLANAQISYVGSGELDSANRVPWGTSLLFKLWPF